MRYLAFSNSISNVKQWSPNKGFFCFYAYLTAHIMKGSGQNGIINDCTINIAVINAVRDIRS